MATGTSVSSYGFAEFFIFAATLKVSVAISVLAPCVPKTPAVLIVTVLGWTRMTASSFGPSGPARNRVGLVGFTKESRMTPGLDVRSPARV